jgi:spore maturation protein CgeB
MVSNRVPDAHLFLTEGEDYVGFTGMDEGIEKVLYLKNNPDELERIARNGYQKIRGETYDVRVEQILRECGF